MTTRPARRYEETGQPQLGTCPILGWEWPPKLDRHRRDQVEHLAHIARLAVGRLGARLDPYLDEGLVVGRALMALMEMDDPSATSSPDAEASVTHALVERLRSWIRGGAWFEAGWRRRVEPLCETAAQCGVNCPELLADKLGLDDSQLEMSFLEAGLIFGVCPERMLPLAQVTPDEQALVATVVGELSEHQRTMLTLYFREGLGFIEIAELLDLPGEELQASYGRAGVHIRSSLLPSQMHGLYGEILGNGTRHE